MDLIGWMDEMSFIGWLSTETINGMWWDYVYAHHTMSFRIVSLPRTLNQAVEVFLNFICKDKYSHNDNF